MRISSIIFLDEIIKSLIRFHTFTGNDYISSFYRKAKVTCFKILPGVANSKARLHHLVMI